MPQMVKISELVQGIFIDPFKKNHIIYLDTLLESLRSAGIGCYVSNTFMGAMGYADDIILLAPTRLALQEMLNICEEFSHKHHMLFSTDPNPTKSKTKCLYFTVKQEKVYVTHY